jgi:hypothetical protein
MLIQHRILLELPNRYGFTPLHIAARLGAVSSVKALVRADRRACRVAFQLSARQCLCFMQLAAGVDVNAGDPHVQEIVPRKNKCACPLHAIADVVFCR